MNLREKYRPNTISDLVGCEEFTDSAKVWTIESCPANLLFAGPPAQVRQALPMHLLKICWVKISTL